jgi:uncharacterized protein YgiM (DUF1202 family)
MSHRTCRVGVNGRNDQRWEEEDFRIVRDAKLEAIKMMSLTDMDVFRRLKQENPDIEIITRLYGAGFGTGHHPTSEQFANEMIPIMQNLKPFCTMFQIHNEPNHVERIEGWGRTDADAEDFNRWFLDVYARLKQACPWASLGFPGLAVPDDAHHDKAWLCICRPAIERADWLGCHCYWQSPGNSPSVMLEDHSGLCFKYYHEMYPDKVIHILECGNSNGQGNHSTDPQLYGDEYARWLQEVFNYPYIGSAAFFVLSSPDAAWASFAWRNQDGVKEQIVQRVADLDRPALQQVQMSAAAGAAAQDQIGIIPAIFTNQNLIDAFYRTAQKLGLGNWDVLNKAGLDVNQLAQDRPAVYAGAPVASLSNLSDAERAAVKAELVKEMRKDKKWQGVVQAPAGLNLRTGPGGDQRVLKLLADSTKVDVLFEQGSWLFVATDDDAAGYVNRDYVARAEALTAAQPIISEASVEIGGVGVGALPGSLASLPELANVPLPPERLIMLSNDAGDGARLLAGIWNRVGGLLRVLSEQLQIDPAVALAVLAVESGGRAFSANGRMIIRFENHLFYQYWGRNNQEIFNRYFTFSDGKSWEGHAWRSSADQPFREFHGSQLTEWQVLDFAASLDDTAAKMSISMGGPQILGMNHRRIGYASVQDMFRAFQSSERSQILGLFDFIKADTNMLRALRSKDYPVVAAGYNGTGQAGYYAGLIASWVQAFDLMRPTPGGVAADVGAPAVSQLPSDLDATIFFLPMPTVPDVFVQVQREAGVDGSTTPASQGKTTALDRELREMWVKHMRQGLENNNIMFSRILRAFMAPYYMTIVMYAVQFAVGIGLFLIAAWLSAQGGKEIAAAIFAGLGVATFLTYFVSRPLRSLEENLQFITWLGIVYNTYWTHLLYSQDADKVHDELKDATATAVGQIEKLVEKNAALARRRPGVR